MIIQHLGQVPSVAAEKFGDREAMVFEDRSFSFSELNAMIERAAAGLAATGIKPGDIVTLYAGNSWEWVVSYYAVLRLGVVVNPINTMLTPEEVLFVVSDCGAKAIIASADKVDPLLGIREQSDVETIVAFGQDVPAGVVAFGTLLNEETAAPPQVPVDPNALSTLCYTSGTTGHPKGAMQSHRAVLTNVAMTAQAHMRGPQDCAICALPLPHVYGNVLMNSMMMFGTKLVLHARFDPAIALADIERQKATIIDGVPTMYAFLLNHPDLAVTDLSSLTRAYVGGQTMPVAPMEAVEKRFGIPLIELWGMTEIAGLGSTFPLYGQHKHGSIGCAMPFCELRIADPDDAATTRPRGEVGELMVRGPIVMMGYYGDEAKTRETLEPDGWLHTGDLASMDEDGCVFIVDRKKDMILTGGFNVYPAEIERVLAGHPDVALAAVGRKPDDLKGEIAKAYVVLKQGATGDAEEMIGFCRKSLAAYKCPREIQFVQDVPKTSTGKIMRRELYTLDISERIAEPA